MLQHAAHTKGYLPEKIKQNLRKTTLSSGGHAGKVLHDDNARINKRDAVKIIQRLKDEHMAHGVTTTATKFVDNAIHHEKAVEESIARQRKDDRVKDLAKEHAAEMAKAHDKSAKPGHSTPAKSTPLAAHSVAAVQHKVVETTPVHHATTTHASVPSATHSVVPAMPHGTFQHLPGHAVEAGPEHTNTYSGGASHSSKPEEEVIDLNIG